MSQSDGPDEGMQDFDANHEKFLDLVSMDRDLLAYSLVDATILDDDETIDAEIERARAEEEQYYAEAIEHEAASAARVDVVDPSSVGGVVVPPRRSGERVRVIPGWIAKPRILAPWLGSRVLDALAVGGFHLVRSPAHVLRGTGVVTRFVTRFVMRPEDSDAFKADLAVAKGQQAKNEVRRMRVGGQVRRALVPGVGVGMVWMWAEFGQWGLLPATVCGAAAAGLFVVGLREGRKGDVANGRSAGGPRRKRPKVTSPLLMQALEDAGFGPVKVRQDGQVVEQGAEIRKVAPEKGGISFQVVLPRGTTVTGLMKKLEEFAGSLERPAESVVIESMPGASPRHLQLFVASKTLAERGAPSWKWADGRARSSFFDGVPIGVDARGRDVIEPIEDGNGIVGGAKGSGKSGTMRVIGLGAALDPTIVLLIHNLKGGPDYRCFAPVAHTLRAGSSLADVQALADDLAWMQDEIERRGRIMERMPLEEVAEGKLTPKLAKRQGLGPVVMIIDEVQRALASKLGGVIKTRLEDVERTGRAVGMTVKLSTQGMKEGVLPAGVVGQSGRRIVHGVTNIQDANTLGGEGTHGKGGRALEINQPGLAYVGEAGSELKLTAVAWVDLATAEKIAQKARVLREKAGTLSGMAAGDVPADDHEGGDVEFLGDVLDVWPVDDDGKRRRNAGSAQLAELLADRKSDVYGDVAGDDVTRRMKALGVKVSSQRLTGRPDAQGVRLENVEKAAKGM